MPKFAANLSMLYNEHDFLDRFAAAAKDGFQGVEYLFPYAFGKDALAEALKANNLTQVLHNMPAGDWDAGERGLACLPDRVGEFQDGVGTAIDYAKALGCTQLHAMAGLRPEGADPDEIDRTYIDNLRFAAEKTKEAGIKLLIEAINTIDIPGFYLSTSAQALSVIDTVGSDNLYFQYDIYHMQVMEGDLTRTIEKNLAKIPHMQLADNPGRHEPGTGEINYGFLFDAIDKMGYKGWIGCEYKPKAGTSEGLGWLRPYLSASAAAE
ncbi:2-oxo-tetronate isomerase [Pelagibius sp. CAU 1746]|uniref:2-oxo-tetronate isomerase n=1 Tax=Pelagibius sp. CAU 1746 TaxID=3140370 RepID=UPI00325B180E